MDGSWIDETIAIIEDWRVQKANLESKRNELNREIDNLEERIIGGEYTLQAYRNKHGIETLPLEKITHGYFGGKSYPDMLRIIAKDSGGYLRARDAVDAIIKAGVSDNKRFVQANVYSALRRNKRDFKKVRPGEYRLLTSDNGGKPLPKLL